MVRLGGCTAAVLPAVLQADVLLLLTDVPAGVSEWKTAFARPLGHATPTQLRALTFQAATMAPKVATGGVVNHTSRRAAMGALTQAGEVLARAAGGGTNGLHPWVGGPWARAGDRTTVGPLV